MQTILEYRLQRIGYMKYIVVCILLFIASTAIFAQAASQGTRPKRVPANRNQSIYNGVISGRVTLTNGKPAIGLTVTAYFVMPSPSSPGQGEGVTDANGHYKICSLRQDKFNVRVENGGKPYICPIAVQRTVTQIECKADFTVRPGPSFFVRITDAESGLPVAGIHVSSNSSSCTQELGAPNKNGTLKFSLGYLATRLELKNSDLQVKKMCSAPGYRDRKFIDLATVQDVIWNVKLYQKANLLVPAIFRGKAIGSDGAPIAGLQINLLRYGQVTYAASDAFGRFSFQTQRMNDQENDTHGVVLRASKGGLLYDKVLTAEDTWSLILVRLEKGVFPSITGLVVGLDGKPLSQVPISCFEFAGQYSKNVRAQNEGATDANGRFEISQLSSEAQYELVFGGAPQFRGGLRNYGITKFPVLRSIQDAMRLRPGERRNLGRITVWKADNVVSGRILTRFKAGDLILTIQGAHTDVSMTPTADGRFRTEVVVPEPLTLRAFYKDRQGIGFSIGSDSPDVASVKSVQAGDTGVEVVLKPRKMSK